MTQNLPPTKSQGKQVADEAAAKLKKPMGRGFHFADALRAADELKQESMQEADHPYWGKGE